ncbi:TatD family hydrolase [Filifactor alocis]
MGLFDSHVHLDDSRFDGDREELISSLSEDGIDYVVNIGADLQTSKNSIELSEKYSFVYATVGVHPHEVESMTEDDIDLLRELSTHDKVVAIGEIGLDYYYDNSPRELQKKWFIRQIELANECNLPIVIHSRDAVQDTYDILEQHNRSSRLLIHCFSQSLEMAKKYVNMGAFIALGGAITFKNAKHLLDVVKFIPMEHLLLETDCPYLTPEPFRGKRNDPSKVRFVAQKIAELKNIDFTEVVDRTNYNARMFYGI